MTYYRMSICVLLKRTSRLHLHQIQYHSIRHLAANCFACKRLRDELAKCSAAVFMVDDIAILENVQTKVHSIHSELLSTSSIFEKEEELPILKNLMKEEVSEYWR